MSDKTTWWRVDSWRNKPRPAEIVRETKEFLVQEGNQRVAKESEHHRFYRTEAEAWIAIADRAQERINAARRTIEAELEVAEKARRRVLELGESVKRSSGESDR